jgi:hypothetical protein
MKKLFAIVAMAAIIGLSANAQENLFFKGDQVINIGLGLGSTVYTGTYYKTSIPPVSISFEQGVKEGVLEKGVIGVGGYMGYSSYKWEYTNYGWKYSNFIIGARGTFHYPLLDKIDTYTGILLGYRVVSVSEIGNVIGNYNSSGSNVIWSWYAGGRYYFSEKLGAMAEIGYGITYLNIGIAYKL